MLQPVLRSISPNDYLSWDEFAAAGQSDPWDAFGWFQLEVGLEGEPGSTWFQVLVSTPAAVSRAKGNEKHRRILIVESFEPVALEEALKRHVAGTASHTWDQIVEKLRAHMYWEYEKQWS